MRMNLGLVGLAGCFSDWILTRTWRQVALCFLPLLFAGCTVGLVVAGSWLNKDNLANRYMQLANKEVDQWEQQWAPTQQPADKPDVPPPAEASKPKEIPASAELLFRRVQQLQQNDSRSIFFVALCYLQRGATTQGLVMLNRIAPPDRVGYLPAHAFLTEQLLSRPLNSSDVLIVRHHAAASIGWDRCSPQLLALISDLFSKLNDPEKAVKAMSEAARRDTKFNLLLAQLAKKDETYAKYAKLGEESLEKAAQYFTEKLAKEPHDIAARLMLADAQRMRSDLAGAEQTIVDGLKLDDNQTLKTALSEVYCQVFAKTVKITTTSWSGDMELLEKAFHLDPNNLHIFDEVAKLALVSGKDPNEKLMEQLRINLAEGRATSVTHMWIAEHYLSTNQFSKAIPHLEQAVRRDPEAARCWNNLAYCLADLEPDRLDEALKSVDQAIGLAPSIPDYHDTRGTILMKLKRPGDAIAAFERAIESLAKSKERKTWRPDYHERLAEAYSAAGDNAMADTHRQRATQLTAAIAKAQLDAKVKSEEPSSPPKPESNSAKPEADGAPVAEQKTETKEASPAP